MVSKNFLWKSLMFWQKKNDISIEDTEVYNKITPSEKITQLEEIFEIFKLQATKIILRTEDEKLISAIKEASEYFEKNYINR
jgi:hypothetical protein